MVTVGVLAALVNVFVLITVAIADRAIELIVRNFAASRLHRSHRAPVVHDSDTWLPNIPRSVVKYHRHPAILLTVLCTVFLIAAELISEIGVDVSHQCTPERKKGVVIGRGDSKGSYTSVELGGTALLLQFTDFLDGELERVPAGVPKAITGRECLPCLKEDRYPDLMRGCRVNQGHTYETGEMIVAIMTTKGPFKTITAYFRENKEGGQNFTGEGDLTGNGENRGSFLFWGHNREEGRKVLTYFEYGHQPHINALKDKSVAAFEEAGNVSKAIEGVTKSQVFTFTIECEVNALSFLRFNEAVMVYRTMQLENPTKPVAFDKERHQFVRMKPDDIYKAGLAIKITDDDNFTDDFYVYTTCGIYKWKYIVPIACCVVVILTLGLVSLAIAPQSQVEGIPYNSRSWFRHSLRRDREAREKESGPNISGYFDAVFEEMVLVSDTPGANPRVQFRSRARSRNATRDGDGGIESGNAQTPGFDSFDEPFEEPFT